MNKKKNWWEYKYSIYFRTEIQNERICSDSLRVILRHYLNNKENYVHAKLNAIPIEDFTKIMAYEHI